MVGMTAQGGAGDVLSAFLAVASKDQSTTDRLKKLADATAVHDATFAKAKAALEEAAGRHAAADKKEADLSAREMQLAGQQADIDNKTAVLTQRTSTIDRRDAALTQKEREHESWVRMTTEELTGKADAVNVARAELESLRDKARKEAEAASAIAAKRMGDAEKEAMALRKGAETEVASRFDDLHVREKRVADAEQRIAAIAAEYEKKLSALRGIVG